MSPRRFCSPGFNDVARCARLLADQGHDLEALTLESFHRGLLVEANGVTATRLQAERPLRLSHQLVVRRRPDDRRQIEFSGLPRDAARHLADLTQEFIDHAWVTHAGLTVRQFRRLPSYQTLVSLVVCDAGVPGHRFFFLHHPALRFQQAVDVLGAGLAPLRGWIEGYGVVRPPARETIH
ncbi:MAG: hypothetical protein HY421_00420 [Candidatus Kerfeldbacteria bacterium]|nr:hypothetical protein [Candidatus Kerfeldbacteria bacterium]